MIDLFCYFDWENPLRRINVYVTMTNSSTNSTYLFEFICYGNYALDRDNHWILLSWVIEYTLKTFLVSLTVSIVFMLDQPPSCSKGQLLFPSSSLWPRFIYLLTLALNFDVFSDKFILEANFACLIHLFHSCNMTYAWSRSTVMP